jgi:hypothetical protein
LDKANRPFSTSSLLLPSAHSWLGVAGAELKGCRTAVLAPGPRLPATLRVCSYCQVPMSIRGQGPGGGPVDVRPDSRRLSRRRGAGLSFFNALQRYGRAEAGSERVRGGAGGTAGRPNPPRWVMGKEKTGGRGVDWHVLKTSLHGDWGEETEKRGRWQRRGGGARGHSGGALDLGLSAAGQRDWGAVMCTNKQVSQRVIAWARTFK